MKKEAFLLEKMKSQKNVNNSGEKLKWISLQAFHRFLSIIFIFVNSNKSYELQKT